MFIRVRIHPYIVSSHSEQLDVSSYLEYCVEKDSLVNEMWIWFLACRECYRTQKREVLISAGDVRDALFKNMTFRKVPILCY